MTEVKVVTEVQENNMDVTKEIPAIEKILDDLANIITEASKLNDSPEKNIIIMKLKESNMWLNLSLNSLKYLNK